MKNTFIDTENLIIKKWYLIDANEKTLGRLATQISVILMEKNKKNYTPFLQNGNCVIVTNAEKIKLTGKKAQTKIYRHHSGRPGGMKIQRFANLIDEKPEFIIEKAVKGMLPKGARGNQLYRNLKVYKGETHPHQAQQPEIVQ
jgi:large subunit ribosomal protein L13